MAKKMIEKRKKLVTELEALIQDIPEEGLLFLLEQANTILYNMKVDEVNKAAQKLNASRSKAAGGKKSAPAKSSGKGGKSTGEPLVWVEEGTKGRSMVLIINNERKIMDQEEEMLPLVRIAHKAASKKEGTGQLYRWLKRERDDIVMDAGLTASGPAVAELYDYLRKNFSLKSK